MRTYLKESHEDRLVIPKAGLNKEYLPMGAPLLDFLTVETEGSTGWKYPKLKELRSYQDNRGLTFSVLEEFEVREIICGVSTQEEIEKFHEWITEKHLKDQNKFNSGVLSMDVEDVKASYYDVMRMAGELVISNPGTQIFKSKIDDRPVPGINQRWSYYRFYRKKGTYMPNWGKKRSFKIYFLWHSRFYLYNIYTKIDTFSDFLTIKTKE